MNVILITILLTTVGLCLVAFLTWLGILSIQLMKFKNKAEESFKHLERWIDDNQNTISRELEISNTENQKKHDDIYNNITTHINEVFRTMESNGNENQRKIDVLNNKPNEIYRTMDTHVASLNSKIDSRCDKLQDKLDHLWKTTEQIIKTDIK